MNIHIYNVHGVSVAVAPIEPADGLTRRQRERRCVDQMLSQLVPGAVLTHAADGAPLLEGVEMHISVSHCREYAAVALCPDGPVGIDIEQPRPSQLQRVASRFLTTDEQAAIGPDHGSLLRAWTAKEAAYKLLRPATPSLQAIALNTPDLKITHVAYHDATIAVAQPR